jgi:hypothetical protein
LSVIVAAFVIFAVTLGWPSTRPAIRRAVSVGGRARGLSIGRSPRR